MQNDESILYPLEWNDAMSVGIEAIDNDHKALLVLIIKLSNSIEDDYDRETIVSIFSELEAYIIYHFTREEAIMRKRQYKGLESHLKLHQNFIDSVPKLKNQLLTTDSKQVAEETLLFLFDWLINHILGEDMKITRAGFADSSTTRPQTTNNKMINTLFNRSSFFISRHIGLPIRIRILSILPTLGMLALSIFIISESSQKLHDINILQQRFNIIRYASDMNHSIQVERGLSSQRIRLKNQLFSGDLIAQRLQTDSKAAQFLQYIGSIHSATTADHELLQYIQATKQHLYQLADYRQHIDNNTISNPSMLAYYTEFITILRDLPDSMIHLNMNSDLSNNIIAFSALMHLKESTGLQRAMGQPTTAHDRQAYIDLMHEKDSAKEMFMHTASPEQLQKWVKGQKHHVRQNIIRLEKSFIIQLSNEPNAILNEQEWFKLYTERINQVMAIAADVLHQLDSKTQHQINQVRTRLYISLTLLISLFLLIIVFTHILTRSITHLIQRLTHALTRLSKNDKRVRLHHRFAHDDLDMMATAYEKCRISMLQSDLKTAIYIRRQESESKRKMHAQQIKSVIQDYALDCIITCDNNFIIVHTNPATESLFKLKGSTAVGISVTRFIPDIEQHPLNEHIETQAIRQDQTCFWVTASIARISMDRFEGFICFVRDISAHKRAEANVHKLSQAIEQAGESILITDRNGIIEYVNTAFTTLTGYSAKQAIGNTPNILKSGNQDTEFYTQMWQTIIHGHSWQDKVIEKRQDGSFFPAILTIAPITDNNAIITHFVGTHTDITDLEEMQEQFQQAQKMEAIGTLVGGIAHDFNNMLAGITGNLYLAKLKTKNIPEVIDKLDNIEDLSFRAASMIKQLLTFARKDIVSMELMSLSSFIKETMTLLQPSIPENICLQQQLCTDDLIIKADTTQLHQVLMNLINNARDAVENSKEPFISICLETFQPDKQFVQKHQDFSLQHYALLTVTDNGDGISASHMKLVFEPFFTSKEQGKGTGLGLSMVYGAVANHQGHIIMQSIEGNGTTFQVYLPLIEERVTPLSTANNHADHDGHGKLILLADDQTYVLTIMQEILESMNYKTLTVENGKLAVALYKAHRSEIDLCIFDVVMPIMSGDQAAKIIRAINPEAKIIFATGYDKEQLNQMNHEIILAKPFNIEEIQHSLNQAFSS
ncbi:MAG: bacteriohemerythrin [Mariprofundaceae bacterium]